MVEDKGCLTLLSDVYLTACILACPVLKKFDKILAPTQNVVYICQKMTHAKYFFCNAKIATTQALQNF